MRIQFLIGNDRVIGRVTTFFQDLLDKRNFNVLNANGGDTNGRLIFRNFEKFERPSFVDYLRSGWQIGLTIAIDYTASNGAPSTPQSLHYLGANNQYEKAIYQVGQILEPYDQTRQFATFGFGGIPRHMGMNTTSHCFPLNGQPQDPRIYTIGGILETYRGTINNIGLSGPTNFATVINTFGQHAHTNAQF